MARDILSTGRGSRFLNLVGLVFGRLTVIEYAGKRGKESLWLCHCSCSDPSPVAYVTTGKLRSGHTSSCGCLQRERASQANVKHGGVGTAEYGVWDGMVERCTDQNCRAFHNYGGRGLRVCSGWLNDFAKFLADMGRRPSPLHQLDRIDNARGYDCGCCDDCRARGATPNCRWTTRTRNMRNKRSNRLLTYGGETYCVAEWAEKKGMQMRTLHQRLRLGWSVADALERPVRDWGR